MGEQVLLERTGFVRIVGSFVVGVVRVVWMLGATATLWNEIESHRFGGLGLSEPSRFAASTQAMVHGRSPAVAPSLRPAVADLNLL